MSDNKRSEFLDVMDATSNDKLRKLVDQWREKANHTDVFKPQAADNLTIVYEKVADELEEEITNE